METIPIIKISDDQFKFINSAVWSSVTLFCRDCHRVLTQIPATDIPGTYPANRPIVFKCKVCGGGCEDKILFVVK